MHAVFHEMDKDCNGSIELHEFQRAMAKLEAPLDDNEARAVFEHIDSHGNCDGRVEYKEVLAAIVVNSRRRSEVLVTPSAVASDVDEEASISPSVADLDPSSSSRTLPGPVERSVSPYTPVRDSAAPQPTMQETVSLPEIPSPDPVELSTLPAIPSPLVECEEISDLKTQMGLMCR